MFGRGAVELFAQLPPLDGLDPASARRMLSTAYLDILASRADGQRMSGPERADVTAYLRRLANAIESYAVFDPRTGEEVRNGAAFVAAEALALAIDLGEPTHGLADPATAGRPDLDRLALRVEASLLYVVAGLETNATSLLPLGHPALTAPAGEDRESAVLRWTLTSLVALCHFDTRAVASAPPSDPRVILGENLSAGVRAALLQRIGEEVYRFLGWLRGDSENGADQAQRGLAHVHEILASERAQQHADIFHLARMTAAAIGTAVRRAVRAIPVPGAADDAGYRRYLLGRARGSAAIRPRPLLWPAAQEYVQLCVPGPSSHAIVSVPTGAGKSFLAELAVSQGLATGWALYLVPTNALANQVRRDLESTLEGLDGTQVRAFLGGDEYTTLSEEYAANIPRGTVVVMTPEKCALALRLAPEAFATCRVCVFDECHLLADGTRGVLAELVVSHVSALAPGCRFVLMSAMMANPRELGQWLESATGVAAAVIQTPWRPTRTMRGVVGVDFQQATVAARAAWSELGQQPIPPRGRRRRRMAFQGSHVVVANLQGAWSQTSAAEYALVRLPTRAQLAVARGEDGGPTLDSSGWVNATSAALTRFLAERKLSVIAFLPSNRHHCFSVANRVALPEDFVAARPPHTLVESLLTLAEDELGVESAVGLLIHRRVSVHTSALLDSEKRASEIAFQDGIAGAMFATGTLAQGLNLPASVVIIGGTAVGDRREASTPEGRQRARSQLLNALGRAGRAGFANQGLALVITDQPLFLEGPGDAQKARQEAAFLVEEDDSTIVDSRLQTFLVAALGGSLAVETASPEELVAFSYLPFEPVAGVGAEQILRRSFALHRTGPNVGPNAAQAALELARVGREFIQRVAAPEWLRTVAYMTGLPFLVCLRVQQAFIRAAPPGSARPTTVVEWRGLLFRTLALLPPDRARMVLGKVVKSDELSILWDMSVQGDDPAWDLPAAWRDAWTSLEEVVALYLAGEPLAALSRRLFSIPAASPVDPGRGDGKKPIPRTIDFVNSLLECLSRMAGVLLALDEATPLAPNGPVRSPESVAALRELPLAIRYGCPTRSTLAWFRFGIRLRRPAHLLARLFPVPEGVQADADVRTWIRQQRSRWLQERPEERQGPMAREDRVLDAVRVVLSSRL
jgi:hypothetical protein